MKKKIVAAGLAGLLALSVAACESDPDVDIDNTTPGVEDTVGGVEDTLPTETTTMEDTSTTAPAG